MTSATNGAPLASASGRLARVQDDYYPTRPEYVIPILPHLPPVASVFDPAAGVGELLGNFPHAVTVGIELDATRAARCEAQGHRVACGDALAKAWPTFDLVIMNPPFSEAERFMAKAFELRAREPRITIAALLRLSWCEPTDPRRENPGRRAMHEAFPCDMHVLPTRPRFRADSKGTDSVTCAWFLYGPGRSGRWSVLPKAGA